MPRIKEKDTRPQEFLTIIMMIGSLVVFLLFFSVAVDFFEAPMGVAGGFGLVAALTALYIMVRTRTIVGRWVGRFLSPPCESGDTHHHKGRTP